MLVNGKHFRTIWEIPGKNNLPDGLEIIDQRYLPHRFFTKSIFSSNEMITAIKDMSLRGAPLIGVAGAYAVYLATKPLIGKPDFYSKLIKKCRAICSARPTAVNLQNMVDSQLKLISSFSSEEDLVMILLTNARDLAESDIDSCKKIGETGLKIISDISNQLSGRAINILTHCNAGWLATVDYGTATAPIYLAHKAGINLHVWVDETRPRNQGALTAWELSQQGIPLTYIVDNTGGYLMQKGKVDIVITGADRVTKNGDVVNKIGTYLKALAAFDNKIPFYFAFPESTIDKTILNINDIPIEERNAEEVLNVQGETESGITTVRVTSKDVKAVNYGFDITPAHLITGYITENGLLSRDEFVEYLK